MTIKTQADRSEERRASLFISYSRDDKDFVRRLNEALARRDRETWVDLEDIRPTEEWLAGIYSGIEGANAFVFVISPESVGSKSCLQELNHAVEHNKRLIPIVRREVDASAVPESLRSPQWIFFRGKDEFEEAFEELVDALDTDLVWVRAHTRLLTRAIEWDNNGRDNSFVLRANDLNRAEEWQVRAADKEPKLTALQTEFILASRTAATRRQRITLGAVMVGLVVALVLGSLAWWQRNLAEDQRKEAIEQRNEAVEQRNIALTRLLTTHASELQESQPDVSLLLNVEALRRAPAAAKEETRFALLGNLVRSYHVATQLDHRGAVGVDGVAFSPDGKLLASAGEETVRLWDVASGEARGEPLTIPGGVGVVAFSPDSKLLASGNVDGTVRLWDVASGEARGEPLTGHTDTVHGVAFSPDGKLLASASADNTVRLWDVASGKPLGQPLEGHTDWVNGVAFSPDGKLLASASADKTVRLWDVASGEVRGELRTIPGGVRGVAFSPDGKLLAAASGSGMVSLWDVASGEARGEPLTGHTDVVTEVAFSPDGKLLASASLDKTVRLWDVASGEARGETLTGHTDAVVDVAFSPDGKLLATASWDGTARLWDVVPQQPLAESLTHTDWVSGVAFSPDGKLLASASDRTVTLWEVASPRPLPEPLTGHTDVVNRVAFSPDGKLLASASLDKTVRLWDVASGEARGEPLTGHTDTVNGVAFSPDGKLLASVSLDKTVRLWDVASGEARGEPLTGHTDTVVDIAFSPDGKLLASASQDETVRLWDVASGEARGELLIDPSGVWGVAFSPDGKLLAAAGASGMVSLRDVASGEARGEPLSVPTAVVTEVAFSPDGKLLASAGTDKTVRLWDVASGEARGEPLTGHTDAVVDVAFSPDDGKLLASASVDKTVRLWDIEEESLVADACATANRDLSRDEWSRFVGPEFKYVRTCASLPAGYGAEEYVTHEFEPAFRFEAGNDWEFAAPEMIDKLFICTCPEEGQIIFTNPLHVFDPSNLSEPKKLPAPENADEWVSWFQRHPNLDTSKPVPVRVGGASGKQIDVSYNSPAENYPREICGEQPCVPLYEGSTSESTNNSIDGWNDRLIFMDTGGETVVIDVAAPTDEFAAFFPNAQRVLDTLEWKEG